MILTSFFVHLFSLFLFFYGVFFLLCLLEERALLLQYLKGKDKEGFYLFKNPRSFVALVGKVFSIEGQVKSRIYFGPKKKLKADSLLTFAFEQKITSFHYKVCEGAGNSDKLLINVASKVENRLAWEELLSKDLGLKVQVLQTLK